MYIMNLFQLLETVLDKLDSFGNPLTHHRKLLNNMDCCDIESISEEYDGLKVTAAKTG